MTKPIKISKKSVVVKGKTEEVLKILAKSLGNVPSVVSDQKIARGASFFWLIARKAETWLDVLLGTDKVELQECEVELDPFAERIYLHYKKYTQRLLKLQNVKIEEYISDEINNEFVLVREILLRLVLQALSATNQIEENMLRLQVVSTFINNLSSSDVLLVGGWGSSDSAQLSGFIVNLVSEQGVIYNLMKNSMEVSEKLHLNRNAITAVRLALDKFKYVIRCQLLAYFDPSTSRHCFNAEAVDESLSEKETQLLSRYKDIVPTDLSSFSVMEDIDIDEMIKILEGQANRLPKMQLIQRYKLLKEVMYIDELMARIDLITTVFGWLPILTGILNFDVIEQRVAALYKECKTALKVDKDPFFVGKNSHRGLVQNHASNADAIDDPVFKSLKGLSKLNCPQLLLDLLDTVQGHCQELIELQEKEGIKVLDTENLRIVQERLMPKINQHIAVLETKKISASERRRRVIEAKDSSVSPQEKRKELEERKARLETGAVSKAPALAYSLGGNGKK